jgi:Fic family protein
VNGYAPEKDAPERVCSGIQVFFLQFFVFSSCFKPIFSENGQEKRGFKESTFNLKLKCFYSKVGGYAPEYVYDYLDNLNPYKFESFCEAHGILMNGLIESAGRLRNKSVGIVKGSEVAHIAPPSDMLKPLMNDLFDYLKNDDDLVLIKSCVFHYEMEFIHPFIDGNGRMGRLWQTLILKDSYPVFEFLPIETLIKERQVQYYESLGKSDNTGESTAFIEFMLEIILESLEELLDIQNVSLTNIDRINLFKSIVKNDYFTRKEYLKNFREISSATASRDLNFAVENGIIEKIGDKNTTRYKYK